MPVSSSTQPLPPLVLPVEGTSFHDGRMIAGLSGFTIEQTSSPAPPPVGVQSSHPTFPGAPLQSGTVSTVFHGHGPEPGTTLLLPSQVTVLTGIVTGRIAHHDPSLAPQKPCR